MIPLQHCCILFFVISVIPFRCPVKSTKKQLQNTVCTSHHTDLSTTTYGEGGVITGLDKKRHEPQRLMADS